MGDTARIMELFSLQRHDFLNHFQVISGLLQMGRGEQAREYINNAAREITRLSRVVHLKLPEAAAAIMLAHYHAAERGVDVEYEIETDLGGCTIPAEKLGQALEAVLLYGVECLAPPENKDREMNVVIYAADMGYLFKVRFKTPVGTKNRPGNDGALHDIDLLLSLYGGSVKQSKVEGETEIAVYLAAAITI